MSGNKTILMVLFEDKEIVKGLGAKWDATKKQWYFIGALPDELKKYVSYVLDIAFEDKDIFKEKLPSLRWNPENKNWFCNEADYNKFLSLS
jgi:hypothetical protein